MESNSKKGLIVLVVILSLLVVGLSSYLIYDKVLNDDNNKNNEIINDNIEEETIEIHIVSVSDTLLRFVGKYHYEYVYKNHENIGDGCRDYANLELKNDGTYTYSYGGTCAGGYVANGNYSIGKNKIYLFNDRCNIALIGDECMYPNCNNVIELDYTETNNSINIKFNDVILEKE